MENEEAHFRGDRRASVKLPQAGVPGLGVRDSSPLWSDLLMYGWFVGLCVGFPVVCLWMKANWKSNKEVQKSTYLAAFQLVYFIPTFHVVVKAVHVWYFGKTPLSGKETTAFERVFEPVSGSKEIMKIAFASQVWKFCMSMGDFELAWPEFLGSQLLSAVLSYWTLSIPYMQYYAVYYLGVCELTNLPLAAIDLGKYYPSIGDGMATVVDLGLKAIFSALFLYFRVINWFFMSKQVYEDTTFILDSKNLPAGFEYPCPREVVYGVLVMLGMFTLLNLAWLWQIAKAAKSNVFGGGGGGGGGKGTSGKKSSSRSSKDSKNNASRRQPTRKATRSSARATKKKTS